MFVPVFSAEEVRQTYDEALQSRSGANVIVNFDEDTIVSNYVFFNTITYSVRGQGAMMEVGEKLSDGEAVLVRGDGETLPFADDSFDVAMCFRLLVHLPEKARLNVLRELGRVARKRVIAVYQPHRIALWWLYYGLLLRRRLPRYFVPPGDLPDEFSKAGLRLVRSHTLLRGVFVAGIEVPV